MNDVICLFKDRVSPKSRLFNRVHHPMAFLDIGRQQLSRSIYKEEA